MIRRACALLLVGLVVVPAFGQVVTSPVPARSTGVVAMGRVERHIAELHSRLAITPAQQSQWDAFATVMRENALSMEAEHDTRASRSAGLNAVEEMRAFAASTRLHAEGVARLLPVFEALYGTMSAEQRLQADRTFQQVARTAARRGSG